ncbi:MAG: hypothetical protein IPO58_25365 [Betaproteobacteria bacterium]|nr:hypothetical protein [Betaproteobacteria bacterium]
MTLSGPTTITTAAANKNQTYNAKVDGANNLTLAAGSGTIGFNAAVGSSTALGNGTGAAISITSGATTFNSTLATASWDQQRGGRHLQGRRHPRGGQHGDDAERQHHLRTRRAGSPSPAGDATFGDAGTDQVTLSGPTTITTAAANKNQTYNAKVDGRTT